MAGSLFFSDVMGFPPCVLCWYQRIAMYPLVFIFLVGSFRKSHETFFYSTPFIVIGWLMALYHNLIHYEIISEEISPCVEGVSCATVYINWFGFITIPLLSFAAFSMLAILTALYFWESKDER
jgi:disulfide bond formation protein DsbB